MRTRLSAALLCGLTISMPLHAQANGAKDATVVIPTNVAVARPPAPLTAPSLDLVRVTDVRRLAPDGGERTHGAISAAGLGDIILISVANLDSLIKNSNCRTGAGVELPKSDCRPREIALYLDGREIKGIKPESGAPVADRQELRFHLTRSAESDEAWADLLGNPPLAPIDRLLRRPTELSVGLADSYALPSDIGSKDATAFELIRFRPRWFLFATIGAVLLIWLVIKFAKVTTLLRDSGAVTNGAATDLPPYSLGRVQMAFWFVLVVISFVYIWLITNGWDAVNGTVLALIGIGAGTALGSAVIDSPPEGHDLVVPKSRSFIKDCLQDGNGYAFHRFQMFIWTIVLGVLFCYSVWQRLSMPEFSATLLGLLGISGGTYLGFKIPETPGGPPPTPRPPSVGAPQGGAPAGIVPSSGGPAGVLGEPAPTPVGDPPRRPSIPAPHG